MERHFRLSTWSEFCGISCFGGVTRGAHIRTTGVSAVHVSAPNTCEGPKLMTWPPLIGCESKSVCVPFVLRLFPPFWDGAVSTILASKPTTNLHQFLIKKRFYSSMSLHYIENVAISSQNQRPIFTNKFLIWEDKNLTNNPTSLCREWMYHTMICFTLHY